ncbi:hypothetical protein B0H19DRAFT_1136135 [Mycena capillaripes]|nr:hypothetical protein B0H19DRAFT_1136135 [Mycena capillaripes]
MPSGHAYSGAELKIRDKAIEEKYSKEIAALEAKVHRLRYAFDNRSNEYFDSVKYGNDVAELLGFRSLHDVKSFIELADEQVTYKDLAKRVDELKAELAVEGRDKQAMRDDLIDVMEERDLLKMTVAEQSAKLSGPSAEMMAQELVDLRMRFDAVTERADRADKEFKERMIKWRAFKQWMQNEEKQYKEKKRKLREADNMRLRGVYLAKREQKLKDMALDSDDDGPPNESLGRETPIQTKPSSTIAPTFSSSPTVISTTQATGARFQKSPLASTRTPPEFVPISRQTPADQHSSPIRSLGAMQSKDVIDLSETDDDSQGHLFGSLTFTNNIPARSQENDVIVMEHRPANTKNPLPAPHPTLPTRPNFPQFGGGENAKKQRHSDVFSGASVKHVRPRSEDEEGPRKIRRFSSPVRTPLAVISTTGVRSSKDGSNAGTSRGRENRVDRQADRESAPTSTPANTSASKQIADYSAFKGRGRYGKAAAGNDTINASYAIDPARNGGVAFQYDAVVRGKEDRRRMEAGDCECCRDYYEAVGPLPSRLQPPLWRSPPNSPEKRKPCRHGGRDDAITSHKQAISRHRHNWAQGTTPPSYWNIGFPNTQEANNINERAAEMHQQKMRMVQKEAENGGRYYKTR